MVVLYVLLGAGVSSRPPAGLDLAAGSLVGADTPLAAALTALGRFPAYGTLCVFVLALGVAHRVWLGRSVSAVGLLIVAELTSDFFKTVFVRPRPEHWLVTHETSYSYSSGHATNSLTFYGFWAYIALRSTLPAALRIVIAAALLGISAAIGWSRLALGAHYPSDVVGGYLLGAIVLDLGLTVVPERFLGLERQKSRGAVRPKSL